MSVNKLESHKFPGFVTGEFFSRLEKPAFSNFQIKRDSSGSTRFNIFPTFLGKIIVLENKN